MVCVCVGRASQTEFELQFKTKHVGLIVCPGPQDKGLEVTGVTRGAPQSSRCVGTTIVRFNNHTVSNMSFENVVELFDTLTLPIIITFRTSKIQRRHDNQKYRRHRTRRHGVTVAIDDVEKLRLMTRGGYSECFLDTDDGTKLIPGDRVDHRYRLMSLTLISILDICMCECEQIQVIVDITPRVPFRTPSLIMDE